MIKEAYPTASVAQMITYKASKQSAFTIRTLVPRSRRDDAYRAYAYFRWLDDSLDGDALNDEERLKFLETQKSLLQCCLNGRPPRDLYSEEWLLVSLTQGPLRENLGLRTYLKDMMAVMDFDAHRRHRRITQQELNWYSHRLATAVTEAVYTFIGDSCRAPHTMDRYLATNAAHIVHMLRDMHADLKAGYFNIPIEVLPGVNIHPEQLNSPEARAWVLERVQTAREFFTKGEAYLMQIENPRCRIAGAWYAARFQGVLDAIENEDYRLRQDYSDCKGTSALLRMAYEGLRMVTAPKPSSSMEPHQPIFQPAWNASPLMAERSKDSDPAEWKESR